MPETDGLGMRVESCRVRSQGLGCQAIAEKPGSESGLFIRSLPGVRKFRKRPFWNAPAGNRMLAIGGLTRRDGSQRTAKGCHSERLRQPAKAFGFR